ncbi:hypothetical protein HELRODRAFT_167270 [Helobdella robusta]|uniref:Uncharacterized protein n=1 Tax=Helobdella robusta TaxID=6412 RepID=T1EZ74_HELRO|nr:hypothetical protein HELRODRAFT_167270 [Helobdella robusta]ESO10772.1 hypothetical protein HELRODRAFT_167270 [Helobdella robusta]
MTNGLTITGNGSCTCGSKINYMVSYKSCRPNNNNKDGERNKSLTMFKRTYDVHAKTLAEATIVGCFKDFPTINRQHINNINTTNINNNNNNNNSGQNSKKNTLTMAEQFEACLNFCRLNNFYYFSIKISECYCERDVDASKMVLISMCLADSRFYTVYTDCSKNNGDCGDNLKCERYQIDPLTPPLTQCLCENIWHPLYNGTHCFFMTSAVDYFASVVAIVSAIIAMLLLFSCMVACLSHLCNRNRIKRTIEVADTLMEQEEEML